jgi:hypothetical protein
VALFEGLSEDGRHVILDLGPAAGSHLRLYGRFAREVRFAGLLPRPPRGRALTEALAALPRRPDRPYDIVLAWNVLDLLSPEERELLIHEVAGLTASGARLYALVDASEEPTTRPFRFALEDLGHVRQEAAGPPESAPRKLLPAGVERLLAPFEVSRAFTLRSALREYVAVKRG